VLEDSYDYSSTPAEAVTIEAILSYAQFHSLHCLENRNKHCMNVQCQK